MKKSNVFYIFTPMCSVHFNFTVMNFISHASPGLKSQRFSSSSQYFMLEVNIIGIV